MAIAPFEMYPGQTFTPTSVPASIDGFTGGAVAGDVLGRSDGFSVPPNVTTQVPFDLIAGDSIVYTSWVPDAGAPNRFSGVCYVYIKNGGATRASMIVSAYGGPDGQRAVGFMDGVLSPLPPWILRGRHTV